MLSDQQLREIASQYAGERHVTIEIAANLPGGAITVTRSLRGGQGRILLNRQVAELPLPAVQFLLAHEGAHLHPDITRSRTGRRRKLLVGGLLITGVGIAVTAVSGGGWPLAVMIALAAALAALIMDARCNRAEELACDRRAAETTSHEAAEALFAILAARRARSPLLGWASATHPYAFEKTSYVSEVDYPPGISTPRQWPDRERC